MIHAMADETDDAPTAAAAYPVNPPRRVLGARAAGPARPSRRRGRPRRRTRRTRRVARPPISSTR